MATYGTSTDTIVVRDTDHFITQKNLENHDTDT